MRKSRVAVSRGIVAASLLVLLLVQVMASVLEQAPWIVWAARILPLLMFVPSMIKDSLRSYIWLCFVSLLYFVGAVLKLFTIPGDVLAVSSLVSVVSLFLSAMLYVRWRAQELKGIMSDE
ncbi:DUF2069 domain-containing protein [Halieaceae bacterium IMCC14734]|uniref:DUF2069 domain-containing protein n=1 Tax=Candidatus Litorirhabdus singularis TaxID=2518993 RepID=A0ABT3TBR2_9GAMM|nr:DUF2069 domain-containing protein [Candidatus Litorirhabdus singularis]MCX2979261.1 DUF2069 domain-containing protein [Candidatus Litorirhabdus singularis]